MISRKNILVVDDSESIREYLGMSLKSCGYEVQTAPGGAQALQSLQEQNFHLIITDLHMPEMDGISFIREVRKGENNQFIPILFVTTENHQKKKAEAREAGATAWIVKPFDPGTLKQVVNKLIR